MTPDFTFSGPYGNPDNGAAYFKALWRLNHGDQWKVAPETCKDVEAALILAAMRLCADIRSQTNA